ncbi:MAG: cupin domain-containing protein [Spirochaetes bacterium]|nr:MAG: cupin domain-containing protein [Spirochaetota bacterium]
MKLVNESEREYRFGDSGPKYLMKGPRMSAGVVAFKPGESFKAHFHHIMEESFFIMEGKLDFFIDDKKFTCGPGDLITAEPGEAHFLINNYEMRAKAVFMLAPFQLEDKVEVED